MALLAVSRRTEVEFVHFAIGLGRVEDYLDYSCDRGNSGNSTVKARKGQ